MLNNSLLSDQRAEKISRSMLKNQNRPPARVVSEMLRRLAQQQPERLRKACEALFDKAADGDVAAFSVIADRIEGKVQSQDANNAIRVVVLSTGDVLGITAQSVSSDSLSSDISLMSSECDDAVIVSSDTA